jgi:hypothetical protein
MTGFFGKKPLSSKVPKSPFKMVELDKLEKQKEQLESQIKNAEETYHREQRKGSGEELLELEGHLRNIKGQIEKIEANPYNVAGGRRKRRATQRKRRSTRKRVSRQRKTTRRSHAKRS